MNLVNFIKLLLELKSKVGIVFVVAFVVSFTVLLFNLRKVDQSKTVEMYFYLSNSNFSSPDEYLKKIDIHEQVGSQDIDRFITFAYSNELKKHLIDKFNLTEKYNIDLIDLNDYSDLYSVISKKYTISKDGVKGVRLLVYDEDKDFAIEFGKEVIYKSYAFSKRFLEEGKIKQLQISDKQINYYKELIEGKYDTISKLKKEIKELDWNYDKARYLEEDINDIKYIYNQYQYSKSKNYSDSTFLALKKNVEIYRRKYNLKSFKDLSNAQNVNALISRVEGFNEEIKTFKNTIENYHLIKRNINLSKEFIKLDQPTITSISVPKVKVISKFYYFLVSLLIAIYTGAMTVFVVFYFRKFKNIVKEVRS